MALFQYKVAEYSQLIHNYGKKHGLIAISNQTHNQGTNYPEQPKVSALSNSTSRAFSDGCCKIRTRGLMILSHPLYQLS